MTVWPVLQAVTFQRVLADDDATCIWNVTKLLRNLLAPARCAFCGSPCDERLCCASCRAILPRNDFACQRCANPLPDSQPAGGCCADCQTREPSFVAAIAPLLYEFPIDTAIKALKFQRQLFYVPVFADILLAAMNGRFADVDGLVPVPLHRLRHGYRGFNQAQELCGPLSRQTGLQITGNVRRIRSTGVQSDLPAQQRARNVRGAFHVRGRLPLRHPLVVDDVMTTGNTCEELARTLLCAGAREVSVLTLARARSDAA